MASLGFCRVLRAARGLSEAPRAVLMGRARCEVPRGARRLATEEVKAQEKEEAEDAGKKELEMLNKELLVYKEKSKEFEDKYKRALADGENLRRRMARQLEEAKLFSVQSFCKDLLAVADTLAAASTALPAEQPEAGADPQLRALQDGLRLTQAQLLQVFGRHGLEVVNPLKQKFDPNLHEALFVQEVEGAEAGSVVVVSKVGYKLRERCVRPALVGVAK